jgi:hypothetical protein
MTPERSVPDRCDRIVNSGMGEPTECGRLLPCEYHNERSVPRTKAGRALKQMLDAHADDWSGSDPGGWDDAILAIEAEAALPATPDPLREPIRVLMADAVAENEGCPYHYGNLHYSCTCSVSVEALRTALAAAQEGK